jgi:hypothetical protein
MDESGSGLGAGIAPKPVFHPKVSEGRRLFRGISDVSVRGAPGCVGLSSQYQSVPVSPQLDHYVSTDSGTDRHTQIPPIFGFGSRRPGVRISPPRPHLWPRLPTSVRPKCRCISDVSDFGSVSHRGSTSWPGRQWDVGQSASSATNGLEFPRFDHNVCRPLSASPTGHRAEHRSRADR